MKKYILSKLETKGTCMCQKWIILAWATKDGLYR